MIDKFAGFKILIYYDNVNELEYLHPIIKEVDVISTIHKVSDYKTFVKLFNTNKYDVIFIDNVNNSLNKLVFFLFNKNNKQKIVLVRDKFDCYTYISCAHCQRKHNICTLVKPVVRMQIVNILTNHFFCESYDKTQLEFNLFKINKTISNDYIGLYFDSISSIFRFEEIPEVDKFVILSHLCSDLKNYNIKFIVDEKYNVKIII